MDRDSGEGEAHPTPARGNLSALDRAFLARYGHAWEGSVEDALDPAPGMLSRTPVWVPGDRVIVPGTPGAYCEAHRAGGPGEVVGVREDTRSGEPFAYVALDDSAEPAQPYRFDELTREPTV